MMEYLKDFNHFINESDYPAGSKYDSNAPYNKKDSIYIRDVDWIDQKNSNMRIKFELLASDYKEFAILRHLKTDELYICYLAGDDIEEYKYKEAKEDGKDEEGKPEYFYEKGEIDDLSIIALSSDLEKEAGTGLSDWESGVTLVKIDDELKKYLLTIIPHNMKKYL